MENKEVLNTLQDIRTMMNKSSKCLTISGISGVFIGIYAIIGAVFIHKIIETNYETVGINQNAYIAITAAAILIISIITAGILSERKAKKTNESIFNSTAKKLYSTLLINLLPAGILCIVMGLNNNTQFITTIMLFTYGIALINGSQYTFRDILYLGYSFLVLGVANSIYTQYSLLFWTMGFGLLHISYGIVMYFKYEKNGK